MRGMIGREEFEKCRAVCEIDYCSDGTFRRGRYRYRY